MATNKEIKAAAKLGEWFELPENEIKNLITHLGDYNETS